MSLSVKYSRSRVGMAGDPGLGSIFKKAVGAVGGLIKRVAPVASVIPGVGPIVAGVAGAIGGAIAGSGRRAVATVGGATGMLPMSLPNMGSIPMAPSPDVRLGPVGIHFPGGAPGVGVSVGGTGLGMFPAQAQGRPAGYRLNKSSYFLRDGTFVPAGTRWVRSRRRNPLNPRALDRAMGRITSAKRAAGKLSRITIRDTCRTKR